jgi:hypothetical protein
MLTFQDIFYSKVNSSTVKLRAKKNLLNKEVF